jgi:DNA-binding transcriptional MerR regulator
MDNRNYSQITFEFNEATSSPENEAAIGVRIKSIKTEAEQVKNSAPETTAEEEPLTEKAIPESVTAPVKKSTRGRKSLKALDAEADLVNIPDDETLFQRQYYSIGEVADMFGVNQSLLRFWENEFDIIQPRKNRKGDRHFRPVDIKNLELIYDLLRRRKLTIEGAKDFLKKNSKAAAHFEMIQSLQSLKGFLLEIKAAL